MMKTKKIYKCPNCGASVTGDVCKYCRTKFYDFTDSDKNNIDVKKNKLCLSFNMDGKPIQLNAYCSEVDIKHNHFYFEGARNIKGQLTKENTISKRIITVTFVEI